MSDELRVVNATGETLPPGAFRVIKDEWYTDEQGRTVRKIIRAERVDGPPLPVDGVIVYDIDPR